MDTLFLGGIFVTIVNSFVWLLIPICFIIQVFGIRLYKIIDQRKADVILRKLKNNIISSNYIYSNSEFKPNGIFISWYSIGNIWIINEIESEVKGTIVKVLVDDASPVEFDQPLFLVQPA